MKKIMITAFFTMCYMLFLTRTALAYIDPSATAPIIQVIAGFLIAAGAALGIFWKKIKNAITKNKYKKIEKDLEKKAAKRDER